MSTIKQVTNVTKPKQAEPWSRLKQALIGVGSKQASITSIYALNKAFESTNIGYY